MIQLARQEHDRRTDESDPVLLENQQTLLDALEDIVNIPGLRVDTEADPASSKHTSSKTDLQQRFEDIV